MAPESHRRRRQKASEARIHRALSPARLPFDVHLRSGDKRSDVWAGVRAVAHDRGENA